MIQSLFIHFGKSNTSIERMSIFVILKHTCTFDKHCDPALSDDLKNMWRPNVGRFHDQVLLNIQSSAYGPGYQLSSRFFRIFRNGNVEHDHH